MTQCKQNVKKERKNLDGINSCPKKRSPMPNCKQNKEKNRKKVKKCKSSSSSSSISLSSSSLSLSSLSSSSLSSSNSSSLSLSSEDKCKKKSKCSNDSSSSESCSPKKEKCPAICYNPQQLDKRFRKWEAFEVATTIVNKILRALDNAVNVSDPCDKYFKKNVDFILGQNCNKKHLNTTFDDVVINNREELVAFLATLNTKELLYLRSSFANPIITQYSDCNCQRKLTLSGFNYSYELLGTKPLQPQAAYPAAVEIDRVTISFVETCDGLFKVTSWYEVTEGTFNLKSTSGPFNLDLTPPVNGPFNPLC